MQEEKQRLRYSEQALQSKGIQSKDYADILQLLETRKSAEQNIERARSDQFYGYAFNVISLGNPQEAAVYLRKVVKHIVREALLIADQHESIDDLLDAIPSIGDIEA